MLAVDPADHNGAMQCCGLLQAAGAGVGSVGAVLWQGGCLRRLLWYVEGRAGDVKCGAVPTLRALACADKARPILVALKPFRNADSSVSVFGLLTVAAHVQCVVDAVNATVNATYVRNRVAHGVGATGKGTFAPGKFKLVLVGEVPHDAAGASCVASTAATTVVASCDHINPCTRLGDVSLALARNTRSSKAHPVLSRLACMQMQRKVQATPLCSCWALSVAELWSWLPSLWPATWHNPAP